MSTGLEAVARRYLSQYADAQGTFRPPRALLGKQAEDAALIATRLAGPATFVLNNPVGTGKTPTALAAARLLLEDVVVSRRVRRVLILVPNAEVSSLWVARAKSIGMRASTKRDSSATVIVQPASKASGHRLTRLASDTLVIVDEAHRGLHSQTMRHQAINSAAAGRRVLLVTATPFQMSGAGLVSFLSVGGHLSSEQREDVKSLSRAMATFLQDLHRSDSLTAPASPSEVRASRKRVEIVAAETRSTMSTLFMSPYPTKKIYGREIAFSPPDDPETIPLGDWGTAYHIGRVLPALLPSSVVGSGEELIRNSDSYMRMLASSTPAWASNTVVKRLRGLRDPGLEELLSDLEQMLHPKMTYTATRAADLVAAGSHVLIFCTYLQTQPALAQAIVAAGVPADHVVAPRDLPRAKAALRSFFGDAHAKQKGVLVVTDRLSESVDLDGGHPAVIHHDLPWSSVRWEQRMGRVIRASSGFQRPDQVIVPLLDSSLERRMWDTLRRRIQLARGVINGLIPETDFEGA